MSTHDSIGDRGTATVETPSATGASRGRSVTGTGPDRRTTETKASFKTTEFMAFVGFLIAVFIAGAVLDEGNAGGLGGKQVWLYAAIVTSAYLISRGLAKSGSRDPYWENHDGNGNGRR
jgi:hypothetical protein